MAQDRLLERPVALKFLWRDDASTVRPFLREARAQAKINHEHVCKVFEAGETQGIDVSSDYEQSIVSLEKAAGLDPNSAIAHNNLGISHSLMAGFLAQTGKDPRPRVARAETAFHRAIDLNPNYTFAYMNLGNALHEEAKYLSNIRKDYSEPLNRAIEAFEKARELNPGLAIVHSNLGTAYSATNTWRNDRSSGVGSGSHDQPVGIAGIRIETARYVEESQRKTRTRARPETSVS